jgi:ribonuclease Z
MAEKEGESMVQVTFMGTGAAFSTRRRTNIALLVQEGDMRFVVECGPTVLYQLDQAGTTPDQISHLFISHRHGDHILGLPMFLLMCSLGGVPRPLTILGSRDVIGVGKELAQMVYPEMDGRLGQVTWIELPVRGNHSVQLGSSLKLSTLPMRHSAKVPVLGMRLDFYDSGRSLVYTGDTSYNEKLEAFAANCDLLIHEANYSETLDPDLDISDKGHSTAREVGEIASRANCRMLALVHLSPTYTGREELVREEAAQAFDGRIIVPDDGTSILL